jgi:hypothetical protein
MSSVSSLNPGVADLLQTLSNLGSPLASSSKDVSALEKASPADLVQLSTAAMQLENVDAMFGGTTGSNADTSGTSLEDVLAETASSSASASSSSSSTASASSTATTAAQLQSAEVQSLLDSGASGGLTGSLFDEIG